MCSMAEILGKDRKQKASQYEATTHFRITGKVSHLVYVITLYLIRCVKKVKLEKITTVLFSDRKKFYLLKMHIQTHINCPDFSFVLSSVGGS